MFKFVLAAASALSVLLCAAYDVNARLEIADTERQIAARQSDLQKLGAIDREVLLFRQRKSDLQHRIDLINQAKQFQSTTADAVSMLNQLGTQAAAVESVSVTDAKKIVIRGRDVSEKLIQDVAKRLGLRVEVRK